MAKPTISHKQKQTLALLWDALSKILEEPAVSMPQALRDQGNAAIASAFESSDEEILDRLDAVRWIAPHFLADE